jgi:hypothetical protein
MTRRALFLAVVLTGLPTNPAAAEVPTGVATYLPRDRATNRAQIEARHDGHITMTPSRGIRVPFVEDGGEMNVKQVRERLETRRCRKRWTTALPSSALSGPIPTREDIQ